MRGREVAVRVLDQVQMLDQQVAPPRPLAQKALHLGQRRLVELPPLGRRAPLARACGPHRGPAVAYSHRLLPSSRCIIGTLPQNSEPCRGFGSSRRGLARRAGRPPPASAARTSSRPSANSTCSASARRPASAEVTSASSCQTTA